MSTPQDLRKDYYRLRDAALKARHPLRRRALAARAFMLAQLAEKAERDAVAPVRQGLVEEPGPAPAGTGRGGSGAKMLTGLLLWGGMPALELASVTAALTA